MYQPAHFIENDPEVLLALMREAPFATLVQAAGGELTADVLPLEVERTAGGAWRIAGHVARANPLWRVADGQPGVTLRILPRVDPADHRLTFEQLTPAQAP